MASIDIYRSAVIRSMEVFRHAGCRLKGLRIFYPFHGPFFTDFAADAAKIRADLRQVFKAFGQMTTVASVINEERPCNVNLIALRDLSHARMTLDAGSFHHRRCIHGSVPVMKLVPVVLFFPSFFLGFAIRHVDGRDKIGGSIASQVASRTSKTFHGMLGSGANE